MANGQILLHDEITRLPAIKVLQNLLYKKDKHIAEEAQRELNQQIARDKRNANS